MEKELQIGWIETDFDSIISRVSNGANLDQKDVYFKDSYPISRIETIAQETIDLARVKYVEVNEDIIEKYCLKHGDILFSHINSDKHLGKTAYFDINTPVIHGINLLLIRCNDLYNSKLLHYLFKYYRLEGKFIEVAQRAVNQSSINQKRLKEFPIPLPPLPEQQRIVAKLDTLFGHLDALKIRLDRIPQLLKDFRQKVLTQAVTGKLTEEWREGKELNPIEFETIKKILLKSNPSRANQEKIESIFDEIEIGLFSIPEEWIFANLNKVCSSFSYGTSEKSDNDGLIPVLRMGNLQNGKLDWTDLKYSSNKDEIEKYRLKAGDLLFNRTNSPELVGKTSIYRGEMPAIYAGYLIKIEAIENFLDPEYLNISLNTEFAKNWCWAVKSDGVSQSNINAQKLARFVISLPSIEEQQEIVHRVESLFAKADKIEGSYQKLKAMIEQLPQALLAKAFRGELVEQLPTDGDARDLLEQIKRAKEGLEKGGNGRKMKVEDEVMMVAEDGARYGKK